MTQEVNDLPGEDFSCWLVEVSSHLMGASGLVWALLLTLGWLVLVQTLAFRIAQEGWWRVEESWKTTSS